MAFSIKELESLSGIKAHTIRIWEQRYKFLKPRRTPTNIRTYDNEELKTLLTVALLNKYGYKISHIDEMQAEERLKVVLNLEYAEAQIENGVNELIGCMIDLKNIDFEEALNKHIQENGLQSTISELIFKFLERTGILWQTNRINPAHEHIVSNIIRQKIVSAINGLPLQKTAAPLYLLFLPEDEHHELGLLFVYYLLKRNGIPVLYLGANVPLKDVEYVIQLKKPQAAFLHLTSFPPQQKLEKFLHQLVLCCKGTKILISGSVTSKFPKSIPSNIIPLKTFSEADAYISAQ